MKKIKLSKGHFTLVDDSDFEFLSQWKWFWLNPGYAARTIRTGKTFKKILMHRLLLNAPKNKEVDHINENKLDNQRKNIRLCSKAENHRNRGLSITNKSGYKGVHWNARQNKWIAKIQFNGKVKQLGTFANKIKAAKAYQIAAKELHGRFANLGRK